MPIVRCNNCKEVLDEPSNLSEENRPPCLSCESTARLYKVFIQDFVEAHDNLRLKARDGDTGDIYREAKVGDDLYRKEGRWVHREMVVDRKNNRYTEIVKDPVTGDIIHSCDEPLDQHHGHGSAKIINLRTRND